MLKFLINHHRPQPVTTSYSFTTSHLSSGTPFRSQTSGPLSPFFLSSLITLSLFNRPAFFLRPLDYSPRFPIKIPATGDSMYLCFCDASDTCKRGAGPCQDTESLLRVALKYSWMSQRWNCAARSPSDWLLLLSNMHLRFLQGWTARFFLLLRTIPLFGYSMVYLSSTYWRAFWLLLSFGNYE